MHRTGIPVRVSDAPDSTRPARRRAAGSLALAWSLALVPIALSGIGVDVPDGVRVALWALFAVAFVVWLVARRRERREHRGTPPG